MQQRLRSLVRRLQGGFRSLNSPFATAAPPGHFHSPLPDLQEILARDSELFDRRMTDCPSIDLNDEVQKGLFQQFVAYYADLPFPEKATAGFRYHFDNEWFGYGDAIILYSFLRHFGPSRVVEVGSGYSSGVMLDTSARFLQRAPSFTFIDPNPERLHGLLSPHDRDTSQVLAVPVQQLQLEHFQELQENDLLFVDSSHVVRIGSDLSFLMFEVLPSLAAGVIVHFHDVLWPFEYPRDWVHKGCAWNEAYFLRSFLQYNDTFEVLFFNDYFAKKFGRVVKEHMPLMLRNPGGSLWLRKGR